MIQNLLWEAEENEQKTYRDGLGIQFFFFFFFFF